MPYTYDYPRLMLTVDAMIFLKDESNIKLLLIQRDRPPFEGKWALPGGFVDMEETLEQSVARELKEETSLENIDLFQFHSFSKLGRDPRGRTVSVVFYGFTTAENSNIKAGDDARLAKWFDINDIPDLAFDHNEIIEAAKKELL
ncbi:MAG: NUDIX hydrolase [Saprospiraceae bacterium]|nr:NUDIX hydrolase [Saprospiraceae bacterium]